MGGNLGTEHSEMALSNPKTTLSREKQRHHPRGHRHAPGISMGCSVTLRGAGKGVISEAQHYIRVTASTVQAHLPEKPRQGTPGLLRQSVGQWSPERTKLGVSKSQGRLHIVEVAFCCLYYGNYHFQAQRFKMPRPLSGLFTQRPLGQSALVHPHGKPFQREGLSPMKSPRIRRILHRLVEINH